MIEIMLHALVPNEHSLFMQIPNCLPVLKLGRDIHTLSQATAMMPAAIQQRTRTSASHSHPGRTYEETSTLVICAKKE
jgi:hypothetical protein